MSIWLPTSACISLRYGPLALQHRKKTGKVFCLTQADLGCPPLCHSFSASHFSGVACTETFFIFYFLKFRIVRLLFGRVSLDFSKHPLLSQDEEEEPEEDSEEDSAEDSEEDSAVAEEANTIS